MKVTLAILLLFMSLRANSLHAGETNANAVIDPATGFHVGQSAFPHGDFIEITSVARFPDRMVVKGHYNLVSSDSAQLALYITTISAIAVPTGPKQWVEISKGAGDFELTDPNLVPGMPHVTMYSIPGGKPFAGIYFGNKEEAAQESRIDLGYNHDEITTDYNGNGGSSEKPRLVSGPNQVLLEYLGNPVEPPANMDARYTREGLTNAILLAAQDAGITVKKVAIDDSEFPFLVGVICAGSDFPTLKNQIKKMDGYEYNGSIGNDINSDGSDTCNAFSIVPSRVYPREAAQQIYRRLWLRQQVFYDKVNRQELLGYQDWVPTQAQPKLPAMKIHLGAETLDAELARTEKEEMTGMMFRTNIQETDSMLFLLPRPQRASFWMKNCPESISAAYISPNGVIEEIHHLEKNDTTPVVAANDNIQFVLEVKDGWFARHHINTGTILRTEKGSLAETFLQRP
jgi:hypothetical protein